MIVGCGKEVRSPTAPIDRASRSGASTSRRCFRRRSQRVPRKTIRPSLLLDPVQQVVDAEQLQQLRLRLADGGREMATLAIVGDLFARRRRVLAVVTAEAA